MRLGVVLCTIAVAMFAPNAVRGAETIYMAAPTVDDPTYQSVYQDILTYQAAFIKAIIKQGDTVRVIADADAKSYFVSQGISSDVILSASLQDIWIRDWGYTPRTDRSLVQFQYRPNYMSQSDASAIQGAYTSWAKGQGVSPAATSPLKLDGGNIVHNDNDVAITTVRVLQDNPDMTTAEITAQLQKDLAVTTVIYLPTEEGDTTGHSDGMVAFIDEATLLVNQFDDKVHEAAVLKELEILKPSISVIQIPAVVSYTTWQGFASACGIYNNMLVTDKTIYAPTYALSSDDAVIAEIQRLSTKPVVAIDASKVCKMGGAVRCLTNRVFAAAPTPSSSVGSKQSPKTTVIVLAVVLAALAALF